MNNDDSTKYLNIISERKQLGSIKLDFYSPVDYEGLCKVEVTGYYSKVYIGLDFYDIFLQIRKNIEVDYHALHVMVRENCFL